MDQPVQESLDPTSCLHCGGTLAAMRQYCLDCGRNVARPITDVEEGDPALGRGTASLAGRLATRGTGLLRARTGGTGLLGSRNHRFYE